MIIFAKVVPTAPDNEMRFGSKCALNAAHIKIGK